MKEGEPRFEDEKQETGIELERMDRLRKNNLGQLFDSFDNGPERIRELIKNIKMSLGIDIEESTSIELQLSYCAGIDDKNQFVDRVFSILQPIYEFSENDLGENDNKVAINEVFKYSVDGKIIDIHLPSSGMGIFKIKKLYLEGLRDLAKIIDKNPDIEEVSANSWIVRENPKLIEKMGFRVMGNEDNNLLTKRAIISREDFLNRYLKD